MKIQLSGDVEMPGSEDPKMCIGHPGPWVWKPLVTSLVFALDIHAMKYGVRCCIQNLQQEVIQDLKDMICCTLKGFIADNKIGHSKICLFRDGVSKEEYQKICDEEIQAIDSGWCVFIVHSWIHIVLESLVQSGLLAQNEKTKTKTHSHIS